MRPFGPEGMLAAVVLAVVVAAVILLRGLWAG
jgi:hypothetical protein